MENNIFDFNLKLSINKIFLGVYLNFVNYLLNTQRPNNLCYDTDFKHHIYNTIRVYIVIQLINVYQRFVNHLLSTQLPNNLCYDTDINHYISFIESLHHYSADNCLPKLCESSTEYTTIKQSLLWHRLKSWYIIYRKFTSL